MATAEPRKVSKKPEAPEPLKQPKPQYGLPRPPEDIPRDCGAHPGGGPLVTDQSGKQRTDVNNIISTYHRTGIMPGVARRQPMYGEVPDMDFNEMAIVSAETANLREEEALRAEFEETAPEAPETASDDPSDEAGDMVEQPSNVEPEAPAENTEP